MTPEQLAAAGRRTVETLGTEWSRSARTVRRARDLGVSGWAFAVAGRAGALGEVSPSVAAAALGLVAPDGVREAFAAARKVMPVSELAAERLALCCRWGGEEFAGVVGPGRLADLTGRVLDAADAGGLPLFAAWREMPVPSRVPADLLAVRLYQLSELYAGAAVPAYRAAGLSPVQALLAGPDGDAAALDHGWQPPFHRPGHLPRRRAWADAAVVRLVAPAFAALDETERAEWLAGVRTLAGRPVIV
ncbi:helix-turn-helix domain-containing protein [Hamadaea tsunoensis]|uniref:helix-turn-helix domain-containing protein n=1 Tax=Hamadaea tsunoensis TaxID=53368 RepID=UPI000410AE67|nr:hypothetical protein [Hamadaea tsunoensis]